MAWNPLKIGALALICGLSLGSPATADTITLKDGRVLEGQIVDEDANKLRLVQRRGSLEAESLFKRTDVVSIQRLPMAWTFKQREFKMLKRHTQKLGTAKAWEKLADWCRQNKLEVEGRECDDKAFTKLFAAAQMTSLKKPLNELVVWCLSHDLRNRARDVFRAILRIDPNDKTARQYFGHRQFQGKWYSERGYKRAFENYLKSQGYKKVKGQWLSPDELKAREQARVEARKRAEAEARRRRQAAQPQNPQPAPTNNNYNDGFNNGFNNGLVQGLLLPGNGLYQPRRGWGNNWGNNWNSGWGRRSVSRRPVRRPSTNTCPPSTPRPSSTARAQALRRSGQRAGSPFSRTRSSLANSPRSNSSTNTSPRRFSRRN